MLATRNSHLELAVWCRGAELPSLTDLCGGHSPQYELAWALYVWNCVPPTGLQTARCLCIGSALPPCPTLDRMDHSNSRPYIFGLNHHFLGFRLRMVPFPSGSSTYSRRKLTCQDPGHVEGAQLPGFSSPGDACCMSRQMQPGA